MLRVNTRQNVRQTNNAKVEMGDGIIVDVPLNLSTIVYDSKWRNIQSLTAGYVSGNIDLRRIGYQVFLRMTELVVTDGPNTWASLNGLIPSGFTHDLAQYTYFPMAPFVSTHSKGPFRMDRNGNVIIYDAQGQKKISGYFNWTTTDTPVPLSSITLPLSV